MTIAADKPPVLAGEQLAVILNAVAEGITVQDRTRAIVFANDAAARATGYPSARALMSAAPEEIVSRFRMWDEAGVPLPFDRLPGQIALTEGVENDRLLRFQVVGEIEQDRWVVVKARPVFDATGQVQLVVNIFHDHTERVRQQASARFLAEAAAALAASLDVKETAACLASLPVPWLASGSRIYLTAEGARPILAAEVGDAGPTDLDPEGALLRAARSEAIETPAHHVLSLPLRARGKTVGVLVVSRPRERRVFAPSHVALLEELAARGALFLDNSAHYAEAQRAIAARDAFLAIASHDMKSPLGAVLFSAGVLQRHGDEGPAWDRVRRTAESIQHAAETMERLVLDLVDLAAADAGRLSVVKAPVTVGELVTHAVTLYEPLATARGVDLRAGLVAGEVDVACDRGRVTQVLGNLIANAVAHAPEGTTVVIGAEAVEDEVIFSVVDRGDGIEPTLLPHVFDRYVVGKRPGPRSTGLGLPIAEALVRAHGGRIWAESELGQGSRFQFTVPRIPGAPGI